MPVRFAKLATFFTAVHVLCAIASVMFSFSRGMARFDDPTLPEIYVDSAASNLAEFLLQPALFVWKAMALRDATDLLEWFVFLLNSALWGVALGAAVVWLTRRTSTHPHVGASRGNDRDR
jgi:hypothetical protein